MTQTQNYSKFTEQKIVNEYFVKLGSPSLEAKNTFSHTKYDILFKQESFTAAQKTMIGESSQYFHNGFQIVTAAIAIIEKNPNSQHKKSSNRSESLLESLKERAVSIQESDTKMQILFVKSMSCALVEDSSAAWKALEASELAAANLDACMKKNVNITPSEEQLKQLNAGKITPKELENILKPYVLAATVKLFQDIVAAVKDADNAYNILKPYIDAQIEYDAPKTTRILDGLRKNIEKLKAQEGTDMIHDVLGELQVSMASIGLEEVATHNVVAGGDAKVEID